MPSTPKKKPAWKVKLHIVTEDTAGYTESSASGYYYKYTGGNTAADNGDIDITEQSADGISFEVALSSDSNGRYDIKSGDIKGSSTDISISHPGGNKLTITDKELVNNTDISYGVTVNPKRASAPDIGCDPTIKHNW